MKKTLTIFTILMFLFSILVIAQPPVPKPIRGYFFINGNSVAGYIVEVENTFTGEVISGDTINSLVTESGGFFFDLSFFGQGYEGPSRTYGGDVIEVRVPAITGASTKFNVPVALLIAISLLAAVRVSKSVDCPSPLLFF